MFFERFLNFPRTLFSFVTNVLVRETTNHFINIKPCAKTSYLNKLNNPRGRVIGVFKGKKFIF